MRKTLATIVAGAIAAVGITAGAAFLTPDTASAQEEVVVHETAGPLETVLGDLVTEGVISQAQADAVAEKLREHGGPGRFGHHQRAGHLETVADLLEMEVADLAEALRGGQSIADLAGADTQAIIDALVAEATERLNTAVDDERITQDAADEKLANLAQRVTDMVNGERPERFEGRRGPGPMGGAFEPPIDGEGAMNPNA
ncbi:MAG: hypothetical protein OEX97_14290 [Acidimicrobiia bacterium]|nr:hypothetical protein [Acidimicrobiia bacterium]